MHLVLLSGGSGKRLWPLSNDARSKQFLKVLRDEAGNPVSMVQRVWRQLKRVGMADSAVIATGRAQVDMIQNQLGTDVPLIVEPERRDTFPAIALAASYLYSKAGVSREEVVIILPVDPYVEEGFFRRAQYLETALRKSQAELALMGVVPSFPSTKYGYIIPEHSEPPYRSDAGQTFRQVSSFREKPDEKTAKGLVEQGALWNCGIFAFRLDFVLSRLREAGFSENYQELLEQYGELPKNSFDYEVVEHTKRIVVVDYDGEWKDLGTWNTLTDEMTETVSGRGIMSPDCVRTYVLNELDIPVAVLGCEDLIVAAGPDGILVSRREASPRVKEIVGHLNGRPMYEERRWGWYRVLDYTSFADGREVLTKRIAVKAGKNLSYQEHRFRSEVWTVIEGEGEFARDGVIRRVKAGDVLEIPAGMRHGILALTDLEFIEVQTGSQLVEEDIVRLCMTWEEAREMCRG
ncbi:mannose-1-phosphate guanylyltransferase RfbM [Peptococcaceae bacterium CEB3]|nr:mannose-1-phosphate guanylyltransferase RfbM [Peptococcaceae bacterium CEB3]